MSVDRKRITLIYKENQILKIWGTPVIKKWTKLVISGNTLIELAIINVWYIYYKCYASF